MNHSILFLFWRGVQVYKYVHSPPPSSNLPPSSPSSIFHLHILLGYLPGHLDLSFRRTSFSLTPSLSLDFSSEHQLLAPGWRAPSKVLQTSNPPFNTLHVPCEYPLALRPIASLIDTSTLLSSKVSESLPLDRQQPAHLWHTSTCIYIHTLRIRNILFRVQPRANSLRPHFLLPFGPQSTTYILRPIHNNANHCCLHTHRHMSTAHLHW